MMQNPQKNQFFKSQKKKETVFYKFSAFIEVIFLFHRDTSIFQSKTWNSAAQCNFCG